MFNFLIQIYFDSFINRIVPKKWKYNIWEYGTYKISEEYKSLVGRRHKLTQVVQFKLWEAGQHNHIVDYWYDIDRSLWSTFIEDSFKTYPLKTNNVKKSKGYSWI